MGVLKKTYERQMVASAIGFARDEILWYFYHLDHDINGKKKGKRDPKTLDVGVVELIWLMKELAKSIRSNVEGSARAASLHMIRSRSSLPPFLFSKL